MVDGAFCFSVLLISVFIALCSEDGVQLFFSKTFRFSHFCSWYRISYMTHSVTVLYLRWFRIYADQHFGTHRVLVNLVGVGEVYWDLLCYCVFAISCIMCVTAQGCYPCSVVFVMSVTITLSIMMLRSASRNTWWPCQVSGAWLLFASLYVCVYLLLTFFWVSWF